MKPQLLDELKKKYEAIHGCYRARGGPCFYIASNSTSADFGRRRGRQFIAATEEQDGKLQIRVTVTVLVTQLAQLDKSKAIGDLDQFCQEVGFERLRETLDRDNETGRNEEILLTKDSDDSAFRRPDSSIFIQRYRALKNEILLLLAEQHAKGVKRVTVSKVFEGLCSDAILITRALNELVELNLLRDLNHSSGVRLTPEGQRLAEDMQWPSAPEILPKSFNRNNFDFFISYASEDNDIAEAIDHALSMRGFNVWRDRKQLTMGDSLTKEINDGLATSRFGIVILSKAFLSKNWPQAELSALQARSIAEGKKVILPVRRDISHEEMAKYLPLLGDKLTIAFNGNLGKVVNEIELALKKQA